MKFKKDGKVYESTEAMLNANCDSIASVHDRMRNQKALPYRPKLRKLRLCEP